MPSGQGAGEKGRGLKATVQATVMGNNLVIPAPGVGHRIVVKSLHVFNSGAATIRVEGLRFGDAGDLHYAATLAANTGYNMNLTHDDWEGGDNEAFNINLGAGGTVDVTVGYEVL